MNLLSTSEKAPPTATTLLEYLLLSVVIVLGISLPCSTALDNLCVVILCGGVLCSRTLQNRCADFLRRTHCLIPLWLLMLDQVISYGILTHQPGFFDYDLKSVRAALRPLLLVVIASVVQRNRSYSTIALATFIGTHVLILALSYLFIFCHIHPRFFMPPVHHILVNDGSSAGSIFRSHIEQSFLLANASLFCLLLGAGHKTIHWGWRILCLIIASVAGINILFFSYSGTAQVIFIVVASYVLLYTLKKKYRLCGFLVWIGVVTTAALWTKSLMHNRFTAGYQAISQWQAQQPAQTSMGLRLEMWYHSITILRQHPWLGLGTGGFASAYRQHVAHTGRILTVNPHNDFLRITLENGFLGLTLMSMLYLFLWLYFSRYPLLLWSRCGQIVLMTFILGSFFNSFLLDHTQSLYFAWILGLCFANVQSVQRNGVGYD